MSTPTKVDQFGTQCWRKDGKPHRLDLPAVIHADGRRVWYRNGNLHRDDGPSHVAEVLFEFHMHGKPHREDGSAYFWSASGKERKGWRLNGVKMD